MILIGDKKELILILPVPKCRWIHLFCLGDKKHYRKDGTCKHTDAALRNLKSEYKKRVIVKGFGNKVEKKDLIIKWE